MLNRIIFRHTFTFEWNYVYLILLKLLSCRADFKTVQMATYPGWDISLHSRPLPAQRKEQLSLIETTPKLYTTTKMVCAFFDVLSYLHINGTKSWHDVLRHKCVKASARISCESGRWSENVRVAHQNHRMKRKLDNSPQLLFQNRYQI